MQPSLGEVVFLPAFVILSVFFGGLVLFYEWVRRNPSRFLLLGARLSRRADHDKEGRQLIEPILAAIKKQRSKSVLGSLGIVAFPELIRDRQPVLGIKAVLLAEILEFKLPGMARSLGYISFEGFVGKEIERGIQRSQRRFYRTWEFWLIDQYGAVRKFTTPI